MYLGNERYVDDRDLSRYFRYCYVVDPRSGNPAIVANISENHIDLHVYDAPGSAHHVFYEDANELDHFKRLDTYATPRLGWRWSATGPVHLARLASSTGRRGLCADRLSVTSPGYNMACPLPLRAYDAPPGSHLPWLVYNPPTETSLGDALPKLKKGEGVVLGSKLAVVPTVDPAKFVLLYDTQIAGRLAVKGDSAVLSLSAPQLAKRLGECDGVAINIEK